MSSPPREHSIVFAVTHVPGVHDYRDKIARYLQRELSAEVVHDPERRGAWPTTREAYHRLSTLHPEATHALVLQDDFVPCPEFLARLHEAVAARPEHPVQLFTHARFLGEACDRGEAWATSFDLIWGGTTVLPMPWVRPFLEETREAFPITEHPSRVHDDVALPWWLLRSGHGPIWHTAPSLLEHASPGNSLVGQPNKTRVAARLITRGERPPFHIIPERPVHYGSRTRTRGLTMEAPS